MNPKAALLALLAATAAVPSFALATPKSHHHNTNLARAAHAHKAHPAELYHGTKVRRASKGPAKRRRCSAAKNAALSSASVSSTSAAAEKATPAPKKDDDDDKEDTKKEDAKKDDDDEDTKKEEDTKKDDDDDKKDDNDDDDNGSSGSGKTYTGDATFYATGLNACGTVDKDTDMIAAVAQDNFDSFPGATGNPNNNPICNKKVHACWEGKCVNVIITDRCAGCKYGALDFSPSAFKKLADPDLGRLKGMTWQFV